MEDFVTFEISKKLKGKGFKYNKMNLLDRICMENQINHPTISQVLKWLREEKKIYIEIFLYDRKYSYLVKDITQICEDDLFHKCLNEDTDDEEYATYEQAALAGIEYVLDNLI